MDGEETLGTYLHGWMARQQTQLQPRTWDSYRGMVRRYLLPTLGDVALQSLASREIERVLARLFTGGGEQGRPLSKRSVVYTHTILHKALADAVRDGLLPANPSHGVLLSKIDHPTGGDAGARIVTWDAEQLRTFLAATASGRRLHQRAGEGCGRSSAHSASSRDSRP
ncbi:MAG TPA: hypothetical protein VM324_01960 [Egibacteraceae bacterium]|jgi:integrase|nr:hypothetical protein [Egibacteraceae bacterium]